MADEIDRTIDYRQHPEAYRIGRGERGVLTVEPYKSELLPHWKFATPQDAEKSSAALLKKFQQYRDAGDFVGMDMARKFLQMGYTRSRRYANHRGGRKYGPDGEVLPLDPDPVKAQSAAIFKAAWERVKADEAYQAAKDEHRELEKRQKSLNAGGGDG
jgi:hypothetical protein